MNTRILDLSYFLVLAEEGNFSRAARRLFVSQPLLSQHIGNLERELSAELFRRVPKGVELTQAGDALVSPARDLLESWELARMGVNDAVRCGRTSIVIGFGIPPVPGLLSAAAELLAESHPNLALQVCAVPWADRFAGLNSANADVSIIFGSKAGRKAISTSLLYRDAWVVAAPAHHRLACLETVSYADIRHEAIYALPESTLSMNGSDNGPIQAARASQRVGASSAATLEQLTESCSMGLGLLVLPAGLTQHLNRSELAVMSVPDLPPVDVSIGWNTGDTRKSVRAFVEACRHASTKLRLTAGYVSHGAQLRASG